jgi:hypothetical protein
MSAGANPSFQASPHFWNSYFHTVPLRFEEKKKEILNAHDERIKQCDETIRNIEGLLLSQRYEIPKGKEEGMRKCLSHFKIDLKAYRILKNFEKKELESGINRIIQENILARDLIKMSEVLVSQALDVKVREEEKIRDHGASDETYAKMAQLNQGLDIVNMLFDEVKKTGKNLLRDMAK